MSMCSTLDAVATLCCGAAERTRRNELGLFGPQRADLGACHCRAIQGAPQDSPRQRGHGLRAIEVFKLNVSQILWLLQPIGCQAINRAFELNVIPLRAHDRIRAQKGKHCHRKLALP